MENDGKKITRLERALIETANDMQAGGLMHPSAHDQIIARHSGKADAVNENATLRKRRVGLTVDLPEEWIEAVRNARVPDGQP